MCVKTVLLSFFISKYGTRHIIERCSESELEDLKAPNEHGLESFCTGPVLKCAGYCEACSSGSSYPSLPSSQLHL